MSRILLVAFLLTANVLSAQQPQPTQDNRSLAERAAAARKNTTTGNSGSVASVGQAANCGYNNESIGFELKCPTGWKPLSEGQMNVTRAISREASEGRVSEAEQHMVKFVIHNQGGDSTVALTLTPMLLKETPEQLKTEFMKGARAGIPNIQFGEEKTTLSDPAHQFVAMRGALSLRGLPIAQSYQLFQLKGYLLTIVISSAAEDQLDDLVKEIRAHMTWTAPEPTPTP